MLRITCYVFFLVLLVTPCVSADTIYLKNGNKISGVIVKDEYKFVEIKINIGAVVRFSKEDVDRIEMDSGDRNASLLESWEDDKNKKEEQISADEKQEAKGLVKYEGKWIMPEEKERLQAMNATESLNTKGNDKKFSAKEDKGRRSSLANKLLSKGNWLVRETQNFSIFYREPSQAKIISDKAEYYFEKIAYDLGCEDELKWDKKCQVYIVENTEKWKEFLSGAGFNADLIGGFVPNYENREMFLCAISDSYLAVTFPHELTHMIFKDVAGKSVIPLWLNEGLANYEASITSVSNELLVKHIKQGSHILLGDLLRIASYPEGKVIRELFYAQSEKLVEFLITQYGRDKFRMFCSLVLKDKAFKDALFLVYQKDFKDIEDFNIKLVEYIVK